MSHLRSIIFQPIKQPNLQRIRTFVLTKFCCSFVHVTSRKWLHPSCRAFQDLWNGVKKVKTGRCFRILVHGPLDIFDTIKQLITTNLYQQLRVGNSGLCIRKNLALIYTVTVIGNAEYLIHKESLQSQKSLVPARISKGSPFRRLGLEIQLVGLELGLGLAASFRMVDLWNGGPESNHQQFMNKSEARTFKNARLQVAKINLLYQIHLTQLWHIHKISRCTKYCYTTFIYKWNNK